MSKKSNQSSRPTHAVYNVQGEGEKARWTRIGAAWLHIDKKGANMKLDMVPLGGRIVVREIEDDTAETNEAPASHGGQ